MTDFEVKNWSKSTLKSGPSMSRNKIGPIVNFENCVYLLFVCFLAKTYSSFCREKEISETNNKITEMTNF